MKTMILVNFPNYGISNIKTFNQKRIFTSGHVVAQIEPALPFLVEVDDFPQVTSIYKASHTSAFASLPFHAPSP